jgi:anti-anti-sigma factor
MPFREEPPSRGEESICGAGHGSGAAGTDTFKVAAEIRGGESHCAILKFTGSLTNRDARVLRRLLDPLNRRPIETVILDLSGIVQIDSTPLGTLLMFVKERETMKYALACALVPGSGAVSDKLEMLGLTPLFEVYGSVQDAQYELGVAAGPKGAEWHDARGLNVTAMVKLATSSPRTATVTLTGYIQHKEAEYISWLLRGLSRRRARCVILDLSGVSYANSPAFGVLVSTARAWEEAYGELCVALAGASAGLLHTLDLLGVKKHFLIATTVEKARRLFAHEALPEIPPARKTPSRPMREL